MIEIYGKSIMETLGLIFGVAGMSLGMTGLIFGIMCFARVKKLISTLKEKEIIEENYKG